MDLTRQQTEIPERLRSRNIQIGLPQTVDAHSQFDDRRMIPYHTFANSVLFSVQTRQQIGKPVQPE